MGPGTDWEMATPSRNCAWVSHAEVAHRVGLQQRDEHVAAAEHHRADPQVREEDGTQRAQGAQRTAHGGEGRQQPTAPALREEPSGRAASRRRAAAPGGRAPRLRPPRHQPPHPHGHDDQMAEGEAHHRPGGRQHAGQPALHAGPPDAPSGGEHHPHDDGLEPPQQRGHLGQRAEAEVQHRQGRHQHPRRQQERETRPPASPATPAACSRCTCPLRWCWARAGG